MSIVTCFVPGQLQNPKNWHAWGIWKHRRYVRTWRERTAHYLLQASCAFPSRRWPWPAALPKRIGFHVHVARLWDDDGLAFGCVPVRDALKDMQVVVDDGPTHGHDFRYTQERAKPLGVRVTIEPRTP